MTGRADPGSDSVSVDFLDCRRVSRVGAVGIVVPCAGEGRGRHNRRIHVLGLAGHERDLVAELAVLRVVQRIRRCAGARIVHAGDHHGGSVARGVRRIDFPGGIGQAVVRAPMVGIDARDFVARPILDGNGQIGRRELLTELRRERIEFRSEVVGDDPGEVGGGVRRR